MSKRGYLTPDSIPAATICRRISFPDSEAWLALVSGMVSSAVYAFNWEEFGAVTPQEAADRCLKMFEEFTRSEGCMLGAILEYATIEPPPGCLPCDGSIYNRVDYPDLWVVLNPLLKIDADTFNTPDLREKFAYGASDDFPAFSTGGEVSVSLTADQNGQHTHITDAHSHTDIGHQHTYNNSAGITIPVVSPGDFIALAPNFIPGLTNIGNANLTDTIVTVQDSGIGEAHNNMPPYTALPRCMVAK